MKLEPIDSLLAAYAAKPLPPSSARLRAGVWREIEERRRTAWPWAWRFLDWRALLAEPKVAIAGLVVAMLTAVLPAAAARNYDAAQLARTSLHFDVFSTHPPGMPTRLLDQPLQR